MQQVLSEMQRITPSIGGPVFRGRIGNLLDDKKIRHRFNRAFKQCGLEYGGTHILRHTFASLAQKATNGNITMVQSALGHRSRATTELYAKSVAIGHDTLGRTVENFIRESCDHD